MESHNTDIGLFPLSSWNYQHKYTYDNPESKSLSWQSFPNNTVNYLHVDENTSGSARAERFEIKMSSPHKAGAKAPPQNVLSILLTDAENQSVFNLLGRKRYVSIFRLNWCSYGKFGVSCWAICETVIQKRSRVTRLMSCSDLSTAIEFDDDNLMMNKLNWNWNWVLYRGADVMYVMILMWCDVMYICNMIFISGLGNDPLYKGKVRECGSDHELLVAKIRGTLRKTKRNTPLKRYNLQNITDQYRV